MSDPSSIEVAIVDYGISNLHSVVGACERVDIQSQITSDPNLVTKARAVILPGVGAFGEAMSRLHRLGLVDAISEIVDAGKPLIGICLGMQLLFESSEEFGVHKGLGIISGHVRRFENTGDFPHRNRVPQIGWNKIIESSQAWEGTLLHRTRPGEFMYFVHAYYVKPTNTDIILSETEYADITYCSTLKCENITAFQFHPEKSGEAGLEIYQAIKVSLALGA